MEIPNVIDLIEIELLIRKHLIKNAYDVLACGASMYHEK